MALIELNFESQYLGNNHTISVIMPDKPRDTGPPSDFYGSGRRYRVLWLLHGTYGDHSDWLRKTKIELYARERDLVVVMPSALNSNYANWPDFSIGYNMYDYFTRELMPLIYGWLPVSDRREDNFIAGLSMGGRGALVYALNHPELFSAAAVLSACPRNVDWLRENNPDMYRRTLGSIENQGGLESYLSSYENTWRIIREKAHTGELPRLYFASGTDDYLYPDYCYFKAYAEQIALDATFEEEDGYGHEWRFWDLFIQRALAFFFPDDEAPEADA
ncbi:MAG: alpha/beta hydrolase [Christensenellales bacterium]|jgi:putative tributyrin esterase